MRSKIISFFIVFPWVGIINELTHGYKYNSILIIFIGTIIFNLLSDYLENKIGK